MKRIKSDWRSSLMTPSLQRLMYLSIEGPPNEKIDFEEIVLKWYTSSKTSRRPGFSAWGPDHSEEEPPPDDFDHVMDWLNTSDDECIDIVLSDDDDEC